MMRIRDPRELAIRCIVDVKRTGRLVNEVMSRLPWDLDTRDARLARELAYGAFRYLPGMRRLLARYVKRMDKLPPVCRALLDVSVYQLLVSRVPDYAVLHEANRLTSSLHIQGLRGVVNGVLRNVIRSGRQAWEEFDDIERMSPDWFGEYFARQWGEDVLSTWLSAWESRPITSFWCTGDVPPEGAVASPHLPHAYTIHGELGAEVLQHAYIQNESAQCIGAMCVALGSRRILDLCAAPGGKSCYIATFGNAIRLIAVDPSQERMARMTENVRRLDVDVALHQSRAEDLELDDPIFDLVLVDAPCSGLGICGRHPEIKWLRTGPADEAIRAQQKALIDLGWTFVKPGGHLLYAVCSLDRQEVPQPPEDTIPDHQTLAGITPDGFPLQRDALGFWIAPTARLDGFCGVLLKKPEKG